MIWKILDWFQVIVIVAFLLFLVIGLGALGHMEDQFWIEQQKHDRSMQQGGNR